MNGCLTRAAAAAGVAAAIVRRVHACRAAALAGLLDLLQTLRYDCAMHLLGLHGARCQEQPALQPLTIYACALGMGASPLDTGFCSCYYLCRPQGTQACERKRAFWQGGNLRLQLGGARRHVDFNSQQWQAAD